jgi:uncharacterized hydrophobic protein (TIGR00271 family)
MIKQIIARLKEAFDLRRDKDFLHRIVETIESGIQFRGVNLYILIFAILICSLGLDINSTAVIIGAMLISPLMGPIIGLGFALGTTNWDLLLNAGRNYLIATALALTTSTLYFLLSPLDLEQSELLMRTQPSIYDVLIAFFGGFAGIMATSSKLKGNVIPGVAIATALMPPLCTAGFGLAEMNTTYLFGALYLYIINTVFIGMATFLACRLLRIPVKQTEPENINKAKKIAGTIALVTFLPAVYLGFNLLQKTRFNNNAKSFIEQACVLEDNYLFSSKVDFDHKTIELVYGGGDISDSTVQMILSKKDQFNLQKANIQIIESFSKPITDIKEGLQSVYMQMDEKDIRIQQLKQDFDTLKFQLQVLQTQSELTNKFDQIITATIKNNAQDSIHLELILKQTLTKTRRGRKISPGTLNGTDSNLIILFVQNRLNTKHVLLEINNLKKD